MVRLQNPVLKKELKLRFRSFKSFSAIIFYLLTLLVFTVGFFLVVTDFKGKGFIGPEMNVVLFTMLTFVQLSLFLFMTPGLTAGAISTEREKQTLNILLTTSQTSWQIIFGKLTSSISYLLLLLLAGMPISSVVFLFGGISPSDFVLTYAYMIVILIALASIGILMSTLIRKTIVAMITTYGIMLFLTVMTAFFVFVTISYQVGTDGLSIGEQKPFAYFFMAINPLIHMASVIYPDVSESALSVTSMELPLWITHISFYVVITALSLWIATKNIRVNMK